MTFLKSIYFLIPGTLFFESLHLSSSDPLFLSVSISLSLSLTRAHTHTHTPPYSSFTPWWDQHGTTFITFYWLKRITGPYQIPKGKVAQRSKRQEAWFTGEPQRLQTITVPLSLVGTRNRAASITGGCALEMQGGQRKE